MTHSFCLLPLLLSNASSELFLLFCCHFVFPLSSQFFKSNFDLFVLKKITQKPKKKKETNGTTEAKSNGSDAKPKKAKTKKNLDLPEEDSSTTQSELNKLTERI